MIEVNCNNCGGFLLNAKEDLHIGIQVQQLGYIYKLPVFFTGTNDKLYFCCKECQKEYYDAHVPKNETMSKLIAESKADIPRASKEIADKMGKLADLLKKYKK